MLIAVAAGCLTKNRYDEAKCQTAISALYDCCEAFYREQGDGASTPSCPKPDLLRLKLRRLRNDANGGQ